MTTIHLHREACPDDGQRRYGFLAAVRTARKLGPPWRRSRRCHACGGFHVTYGAGGPA